MICPKDVSYLTLNKMCYFLCLDQQGVVVEIIEV